MTSVEAAEKRLKRYIEAKGKATIGKAFTVAGQGLHFDEFEALARRLHEESFLELCDGKQVNSVYLVRKDLVGEHLASLQE